MGFNEACAVSGDPDVYQTPSTTLGTMGDYAVLEDAFDPFRPHLEN